MKPTQRALLGAAAFLSGCAALAYQVLWVRMLGEVLGSTAYAVNVVLAVFFTGLGVGAWVLGRWADRLGGGIGLFVGLELVLGSFGVLFPALAGWAETIYDGLAPAEWSLGRAVAVKAPAAMVLLALPTLAMGGTLPALLRHVVGRSEEVGTRLGWLYGTNALGAACGVALAVLLWIPSLGIQGASIAAALTNLAAAGCALAGGDAVPRSPPVAQIARHPRLQRDPVPRVTTLVSGFLAVGLEVLWTRALAARFLSTVYSFATILFAFLLCLGLGSLVTGWLDRRGLANRRTATLVLLLAGLSAMASVPVLERLAPVDAASGSGLLGQQLLELSRALGVMCVPVFLFGLNFPLLCRIAHREPAAVGRELGSMLVANTVGSVLAPLLVGFVLLPRLGLRTALLGTGAVAVAYAIVVLAPWAGLGERRRSLLTGVSSTVAVGLVLLSLRGEVRLWREAPTDRLLAYHEGAAASVAVIEAADGTRALKVDHGYRLGDSRTVFGARRQGLIPLLLHGSARSVLFIGMGTGGSAGAAVRAGPSQVDVLEIVPGLGRYLPWFGEEGQVLAAAIAAGGGARLLEVDGRHFVRTTERRYDAIVGDLFIPWRAGEGAMYTSEHFAAVRSRLEPGGLFVQWLPLYQLGPEDLRTITATFCEAFPAIELFWLYFNARMPAAGLVGSEEPLAVDLDALSRRLAGAAPGSVLARSDLVDARPLLGSWIAGRDALAAWAEGAPVESRDRPRIEFTAPLRRIGRAAPPAGANVERLLELSRPLGEAGFTRGWPAQAVGEVGRYQRAIGAFFRAAWLEGQRGDAAGALAELGRALEETPEWAWIAGNVEQMLVEAVATGRPGIADEAARVLRGSPAFAPLGLYHAARLALDRGARDEAEALLQEAVERDPGHEPSRRLLETLRAPEGTSGLRSGPPKARF